MLRNYIYKLKEMLEAEKMKLGRRKKGKRR